MRIVETSSGRSAGLFLIGFFLMFQEDYVTYPGLVLLGIVFTFSRQWIMDRTMNVIRGEKRILWLVYEEVEIAADQVESMCIERITNARGAGFSFRLVLVNRDSGRHRIAVRGRCSDLKTIVRDFRSFLPPETLFQSHADCGKGEPFLSV